VGAAGPTNQHPELSRVTVTNPPETQLISSHFTWEWHPKKQRSYLKFETVDEMRKEMVMHQLTVN
jgi:hypothetical protein